MQEASLIESCPIFLMYNIFIFLKSVFTFTQRGHCTLQGMFQAWRGGEGGNIPPSLPVGQLFVSLKRKEKREKREKRQKGEEKRERKKESKAWMSEYLISPRVENASVQSCHTKRQNVQLQKIAQFTLMIIDC